MRMYLHGIGVIVLTFFLSIATMAQVAVSINQASGQADPADADPVNFTVVFSEAVTGFTTSDVLLNSVPGAVVVVTEIAPNNGTTYNVAVSGMIVNQDVIATIPAGVAQNQSAVTNTASTSIDNTISFTGACAVVCPANITAVATSPSGALVTYEEVSPSHCGNLSIPVSGFVFPIGTTTVNAYSEVPNQEIMYLIGRDNQLYKYSIGAGTVSAPITVTGLRTGDFVASIDFRPSTGELYALTTNQCNPDAPIQACGRLYVINKTTGVATQVGTSEYGLITGDHEIEFDPVTDLIHMIGGEYQTHYTINPVTGIDTYIEYREGVAGFRGIAYFNNHSSATFTTLYGLTTENKLYTIGGVNGVPSPGFNSVFAVGNLNQNPDDPPVGITEKTGFDISSRGNPWILSGGNILSGIDLKTGVASKQGILNVTDIRDIAIEPYLLSNPTCSFTVTVNAPQPPTITCPTTNITLYTEPGECNANINFADTSLVIVTGSPAPKFSFTSYLPDGTGSSGSGHSVLPNIYFKVGLNTVTLTATNDEGTATCSFTVTVIDNTPPVIVCPENKVVNAEPGTCRSAVVPFTIIATEGCRLDLRASNGGREIGWGNNFEAVNKEFTGGLSFPVGVNTVAVIATDAWGNTSTCSFTVTVNDVEKPVITSKPSDVTVECSSQIPVANIASVIATDNCGTPTITHVDDVISSQTCANKYIVTRTYLATDGSGNTATAIQLITVDDQTPPTITGLTPSKRILAPPNHKMVPITLDYTVSDNCLTDPNVTINITSNEPVNGTGDGDTDPDWEIIDDHHIRLRAERSAQGTGRIYTITVTVNDGCNAPASATTEVVVAHNITGPRSGSSFKVGSTVTFTGEFWDVPGNTHTAKWLIDGNTTVKGIVTEPSGTKNGKITGSYKFTTPGIYKLQMNITDQKGVTTYANTNGDVDAIIVVYDPNGGYTYGGGYFNSPAGALSGSPSSTGKASYGFAMNYFKNSTNPKGETQFEFKVGDFEYNALNFDYLVINKSMAQFKGTGKIIGGQSGIGFIMTVTDGQIDGTGIDKIRLKIYNKNNGKIIYDNQPGATDAALPIHAVGANSEIVIQNANAGSPAARMNRGVEDLAAESNTLDVTVLPNPSSKDFTLIARSNRVKEKIIMQVNDVYGRIIEVRQVIPGQRIQLGGNYTSGTYIVTFIQGNMHKQLKLLKISDHY